MVRIIDEKEFALLINNNVKSNSQRPLIVDCFTDWCPPCRASAPIFEKLSEKYGNYADFVKINVDYNRGVAEKLSVQGVPTFAIFIGNRLKYRVIGADMKKVEKFINEALKK